MSAPASVHVWGFFDDDGHHRLPEGAAPSDLSPYHHHKQVEGNVRYFGGQITNLRVTRTLDGMLVGTEFEMPAHDATARMWHVIVRPQSEWPDPTRPEADR